MTGGRGVAAGGVTRTLAAARYLAADVAHAQRALLPLIVFAAVIAVLFGGDPGPLPAPWAASTFALYPVATWFALVVANAEEPAARLVTITAAGGVARIVAATALVALAGDLLLAGLATAVPLVLTHYPWTGAAVLSSLCAHLAAATTGTAVGLLVARPLVTRIGWSFVLCGIVVVVTAVQPWLPPVGAAIKTLTDGGAPPWGAAVLGIALAVLAAVVVTAVERRR